MPTVTGNPVVIRRLGRLDYAPVLQAMQRFTDLRGPEQTDELWLVEHPPVFTQGLNGNPDHVLDPGPIPVVQTDRGGQVTYHGPGQAVIYCLVDVKRAGIGVRQLVSLLEQSVIALLAEMGIRGYPRPDAPGVYVAGAKLASLGLRIRRGCSYHGISVNVDMDLSPFDRINPCGHADLRMTRIRDLGEDCAMQKIADRLLCILVAGFGYSEAMETAGLPKIAGGVNTGTASAQAGAPPVRGRA
jgi:lipoyl(octanoyl) transferase